MPSILIVGVWGFPGNWHRATYVLPEPSEKVKEWSRFISWKEDVGRIEAHSTTLAIAKFLEEKSWEVRVVIYGLDTLACPGKPRSPVDDVEAKLSGNLSGLIEEFLRSTPKHYAQICERASRVLKLYAEGYSEEIGLSSELLETQIVPGVGVFRLGGQNIFYNFTGSVSSALVFLELDLFERLKNFRPDAVILDISHGINYLPSLALEAATRSVRVYSSLSGKAVGFAVCNSDPVMVRNQESMVHLVRVDVVSEHLLSMLRVFSESLIDVPVKMLKKEKPPNELMCLKDVCSEAGDKIRSLLNVITNAATYGLILPLVAKLSRVTWSPSQLRSEIREEALKALRKRRVKAIEGQRVDIVHDFAFDPKFPVLLYSLELIDKLIEETPKAESMDIPDVGIANLFKLNELKEYATQIGLEGSAKSILDYEIDDLQRRVLACAELLGDKKAELYSVVYEYAEAKYRDVRDVEKRNEIRENCIRKVCDVMERHFYAHAGMERNIIAVAIRNGEISVGYVEKCIEKVDNILKR